MQGVMVPGAEQVSARTITTSQAPGGASTTVVEAIPRINVNPKCALFPICVNPACKPVS